VCVYHNSSSSTCIDPHCCCHNGQQSCDC